MVTHSACAWIATWLATNSLAVIRVPSEEEERARHWGASVNSLSITDRSWRLRVAVCLLIMVCRLRAGGGRRAGAAWQASAGLDTVHLELYRPVLLALDQQIRALTVELEKAAPAALPKGMGALSTVVISREICNWQRFNNRGRSPVTPDFVRENIARGQTGARSITRHGNSRLRAALVELAWRLVRYQPQYHAGAKATHGLSTRSPGYQGAAQESHCRRGSSARCRSGGFIPHAAHPPCSDLSKGTNLFKSFA